MLSKGLATLGKGLLIAAGAGFGLVRGLRALNTNTANNARLELVGARVDALDLAVSRLGEQASDHHARLEHAVTPEELARTLDRILGKLERDVNTRFDLQTRSVEALRLMVGQTDELLQKVLEGLESMRNERDLAETRQ